jgi:hypothetical protein
VYKSILETMTFDSYSLQARLRNFQERDDLKHRFANHPAARRSDSTCTVSTGEDEAAQMFSAAVQMGPWRTRSQVTQVSIKYKLLNVTSFDESITNLSTLEKFANVKPGFGS